MINTLYILVCLALLLLPQMGAAEDRAADFFQNLSKEKNILDALYSKSRKPEKKDAKLKPFTLAGEAGLLSTTGNTQTSIVKVAIESNHEMTNWSNRYETQLLRRKNTVRETRGESTVENEIETTRIELSAQLDYKLVEPSNRLFVYAEYDDNQFNQLRGQATFVVGWSQVGWKEEKSEFRYSIGPGYSHFRETRNNITIDEMIVRGTLFYNLKFGDNARFRQTFSAELGEVITKARAQSSVSAKIFEKLAMKLSINLDYNESVAQRNSTFSTQTSISMVYQFL